MTAPIASIPSDRWIEMDWQSYLNQLLAPELEKGKAYYHEGHGRFEIGPVSFGHGINHAITSCTISLLCAVKGIPLQLVDRTTLRKAIISECQPDLSVWIGSRASISFTKEDYVDLNHCSSPDLVVEISDVSLLDDLGVKRSLYEDLGVSEYWIVDVEKGTAIFFEMIDKGSQRIEASRVLPGFDLSILEEAIRISRDTDQSAMGAWLLQTFQ